MMNFNTFFFLTITIDLIHVWNLNEVEDFAVPLIKLPLL